MEIREDSRMEEIAARWEDGYSLGGESRDRGGSPRGGPSIWIPAAAAAAE